MHCGVIPPRTFSITTGAAGQLRLMRKTLLLPSFLLLATACGPTLQVTSEQDKSAPFGQYRTYALHPLGNASVSELNRARVTNAIRTQMQQKGYQEADTATADLFVNPVAIIKQNKTLNAYSDEYGYGGYYRPYYWSPGYGDGLTNTHYSVETITSGSLVIDVVDRRKKALIWEGTGNSTIDVQGLPHPEKRIPKAIAKIMATFPAAK